MAMKIIKKQDKQPDKRTALLALASDRNQEPAGVCLTPEEMAILVDAGFTATKQKVYHEHLANCDTCYREWLALTQGKQEASPVRKKTKIVYLFSKPKGLAIVGSTLAAAASLVIFFNIHQSALKVSKKGLAPAPSLQEVQDDEKADLYREMAPAAPGKKELKTIQPAPPKPKISSAPEPRKIKQQSPAQSSLLESEELRPHMEVSREDRSQPVEMAAGMSAKQDTGHIPELNHWLKRVEDACSQEEYNQNIWQKIRTDGSNLRARLERKDFTDEGPVRLFLQLRGITASLMEENWSNQCRKILRLLEEETGIR